MAESKNKSQDKLGNKIVMNFALNRGMEIKINELTYVQGMNSNIRFRFWQQSKSGNL